MPTLSPSATASRARPLGRGWAWGALAVASAFVVWLAARFGGGIAGTDQFWYAGDLLMTAQTGRPVSNHVYPLFAESVPAGTLPPRMHDAPVTHLASWVFAACGDAGLAWLLVNTALTLAATAIVLLTARALGGSGTWGPVAFLVFPTTVWAALSPLAEASLAFGVAAMVGALVAAERTGRGFWWPVSGLAMGLLVWGRSNHALLLVFWLVWVAWSWRRGRVDVRWAASAAAVALGVVLLHSATGDAYPNAGFGATLMVGAQGRSSNMDFYFAPVGFDAATFVQKAGSGVVRALTPRSWNEGFATVPILLAGVAGLVAVGRRKAESDGSRDGSTSRAWTATVVMFAGLLATYLGTCAVFQPQTRYLYAAAPVAAVMLDVALTRTRPRLRVVVAGALTVLMLAGVFRSVRVAETLHTSGERAAAATARLRAALAPATADGGAVLVLAAGDAADIAIAYAAVPHPVISVDPTLNSVEQVRELAAAWNVTAVVARPKDTGTAYLDGLLGPRREPLRAGPWVISPRD